MQTSSDSPISFSVSHKHASTKHMHTHTHILCIQTVPYSNSLDFSMLLAKDQECLLAADSSTNRSLVPMFVGICPLSPFCFKMFILLPFPQPPSNVCFWPPGSNFRIQSKPCGRITKFFWKPLSFAPIRS